MGDSSSSSPVPNTRLPHSLDSNATTQSSTFPQLTVSLPMKAFSFQVRVPPATTVSGLKNIIHEQCPGRPEQSGQRIVCHGRLLKDEEVVFEVIKDTTNPTVYLAVKPSSWTEASTTTKPNSTEPIASGSTLPSQHPAPASTSPTTIPKSAMPSLSTVSSVNVPQQFIIHQHSNAIRLLVGQPLQPWLGPGDFRSARLNTCLVTAAQDVGWPYKSAFEQDLFIKAQKEPERNTGGVSYTWTVVDNLPYLSLVDPTATPTPLQKLALETLTYTFPLLPLLPNMPPTLAAATSTPASWSSRGGIFRDVTARAVYRRQPAPAQLPSYARILRSALAFAIHIVTNPTRLLIPICLVIFRAAFVSYIFGWTPDKSMPWFCLVAAWMIWEIWTIIKMEGVRLQGARLAAGAAAANAAAQIVRGNPQPPAANNGAANGVPAAGGPQANGAANPVRGRPNNPVQVQFDQARWNAANAAAIGPNAQIARIFEYLSAYHLQWERQQLGIEPPPTTVAEGQPAPVQGPLAVPLELLREPSRLERISTFIVLFVCSLVPEVWARRVDALRLREGQVRDVYGRIWEDPQPVEGQEVEEREKVRAERRRLLTGWRRGYVRRVIGGIGQDVDL